MDNQEYRDRQARLDKWFQGNPPEWSDLKEELKVIEGNADMRLKSEGNKNRDFHAGECKAITDVLKLEWLYKSKRIEKKDE